MSNEQHHQRQTPPEVKAPTYPLPPFRHFSVRRYERDGVERTIHISCHSLNLLDSYPGLVFIDVTGFDTNGQAKTAIRHIIHGYEEVIDHGVEGGSSTPQ